MVKDSIKLPAKCPVVFKENYRGGIDNAQKGLKELSDEVKKMAHVLKYLPHWVDHIKEAVEEKRKKCPRPSFQIPGCFMPFKEYIADEFKKYDVDFKVTKSRGENPKTMCFIFFNPIKK